MKIIVPATSANLGPGFDSVGIAVSKYLTIEVLEPSEKWEVLHDLDGVPNDENNLLIATALSVCSELRPHRVKMVSDVPLARGLGSSSSVIVAGIALANELGQLHLSKEEMLAIATKEEGHPDNVAPAIFGQLVVSSYVDGKVSHVVAKFPETALIAFIPNYELKTSDSRRVLPSEFAYKEAVAASSIANVVLAALLTGDLVTAGKAIEADLFHERFRQQLVKEFVPIKAAAHELGAYATYLSGAGPTIMVLAPKDKETAIFECLIALQLDGEVVSLNIDPQGLVIE